MVVFIKLPKQKKNEQKNSNIKTNQNWVLDLIK